MKRFLAICLLSCLPASVRAQSTPGIRFESKFLFGQIAGHCWLPISVELLNTGSQARVLNVWASSHWGGKNVTTFRAYRTVSLAPGTSKRVLVYVFAPRFGGMVTTWLEENGSTLGKPKPMGWINVAGSRVILVMDRSSRRLSYLADKFTLAPKQLKFFGNLNGQRTQADGIAASILHCPGTLRPENLPDRWIGYDLVDLVLLRDAKLSGLRPAQQQALIDWVQLGGTIVVAAGRDTNFYHDAFIQELLGGAAVSVAGEKLSFPSLSPVKRREKDQRNFNREIQVPTLTLRSDAFKWMFQSPVVQVRSWGHGKVFFIGFDPNDLRFRNWAYMPGFWAGLAAAVPHSVALRNAAKNQDARIIPGIGKALDSARMPSPFLVGGLMIFYMAIMGPLHFFILHRRNWQPYLVFSVPAIALLFCLIIFAAGYFVNGIRTVSRDVALVEPLEGTGRLLVTRYLSIKPARAKTFDLEAPAASVILPFYIDSQSQAGASPTYRWGQQDRLEQYPLRVWESGYFKIQTLIPSKGRVDIARHAGRAVIRNQSGFRFHRTAIRMPRPVAWQLAGRLSQGQQLELSHDQGTPFQTPLVAFFPQKDSNTKKCVKALFPYRWADFGFAGLLKDDPAPVKVNAWLSPEVRTMLYFSK